MIEHEPQPHSPADQLARNIEALFGQHSDTITHYYDLERHEQLTVVIPLDGHVVGDTGEPVMTPGSYLDPWLVQRTNLGFRITKDTEAKVNAQPTSAAAKAEKGRQQEQTHEELSVQTLTGNAQVIHETQRANAYGERFVSRDELDSDGTQFARWEEMVRTALPYNPRTHGILRHDSLPEGPRKGADRLAPHAEIAAHRREVEQDNTPRWRRAASKLLGNIFGD